MGHEKLIDDETRHDQINLESIWYTWPREKSNWIGNGLVLGGIKLNPKDAGCSRTPDYTPQGHSPIQTNFGEKLALGQFQNRQNGVKMGVQLDWVTRQEVTIHVKATSPNWTWSGSSAVHGRSFR